MIANVIIEFELNSIIMLAEYFLPTFQLIFSTKGMCQKQPEGEQYAKRAQQN